MDKTSVAGGVTLPLGASASVISAAKQVIQKHGNEALGKVVKLHFKTTQQVIGDFI
jgi:ribonuclease HIII